MTKAYRVLFCIFVCLQLPVYSQFAAEQTCTTINGGQGICINVKACQPMLEIFNRDSVPKHIITFMLRQSHCGYDDDDPKTCCPIDDKKANSVDVQTTTLPPSTLPSTTMPPKQITRLPNINNDDLLSVHGTCTTVYNTPGVCKDWDICESIVELMKQALSNPAAKETLKKAHCGFKNNKAQTCCPIDDKKANSKDVQTTTLPPSTLPPSTLPSTTMPPKQITRLPKINNDDVLLVFGTCTTVHNTPGVCKDWDICESVVELLKQANSNPAAKETLTKAHCGFKNNKAQTCCPIDDKKANSMDVQTTTLPPSTLPSTTMPPKQITRLPKINNDDVLLVFGTCTSVYNTPGVCKDWDICESIVELMKQANSNPAAKETLKKAHCGFKNNKAQTCCPIDDKKANSMDVQTTTLPPSTLPPSTLPSTTMPPKQITRLPKINNDDVLLAFGTCTTVYNTPGVCKDWDICESIVELMKQAISNPAAKETLKKAHCGFKNNKAQTCCPIDDKKVNSIDVQTTTLPSTTLSPSTMQSPRLAKINNTDLLTVLGETCTTVYNTTGACKDVTICEPFMALLKQAHSNPAANETLKKAHCGFKNNIPQVCCPVPGQATSLPPAVTTALPSVKSRIGGNFITALPEPPVCGVSNTTLDRVVGGVPAKLGAFPWMAALGYRAISKRSPTVKWNCGGSLISTRHVLTAAHCLIEDGLFIVRLGELDLSLDSEDDGATPVDILIEEKIKHESYTRNRPTLNDVGILVLQRDVQFTEFIRPICLFVDKESRSQTFENYNPLVAGWGLVEWGSVQAAHLQVAQILVVGDAECENAYKAYVPKNIKQFLSQAMCAGDGHIDSCNGDSGGPLMQPMQNENYEDFYYAIGVVSFSIECATAGKPGVYARVTHFMPWIEQKVLGSTIP